MKFNINDLLDMIREDIGIEHPWIISNIIMDKNSKSLSIFTDYENDNNSICNKCNIKYEYFNIPIKYHYKNIFKYEIIIETYNIQKMCSLCNEKEIINPKWISNKNKFKNLSKDEIKCYIDNDDNCNDMIFKMYDVFNGNYKTKIYYSTLLCVKKRWIDKLIPLLSMYICNDTNLPIIVRKAIIDVLNKKISNKQGDEGNEFVNKNKIKIVGSISEMVVKKEYILLETLLVIYNNIIKIHENDFGIIKSFNLYRFHNNFLIFNENTYFDNLESKNNFFNNNYKILIRIFIDSFVKLIVNGDIFIKLSLDALRDAIIKIKNGEEFKKLTFLVNLFENNDNMSKSVINKYISIYNKEYSICTYIGNNEYNYGDKDISPDIFVDNINYEHKIEEITRDIMVLLKQYDGFNYDGYSFGELDYIYLI